MNKNLWQLARNEEELLALENKNINEVEDVFMPKNFLITFKPSVTIKKSVSRAEVNKIAKEYRSEYNNLCKTYGKLYMYSLNLLHSNITDYNKFLYYQQLYFTYKNNDEELIKRNKELFTAHSLSETRCLAQEKELNRWNKSYWYKLYKLCNKVTSKVKNFFKK